MTDTTETEHNAVHAHFGLSYASYLVLPRTLLQSMPDAWQTQFVHLLTQFDDSFSHVPQAEMYDVRAGAELPLSEMGVDLLAEAGITEDWYRGEKPPDGLPAADLNEWKAVHEADQPTYYDASGHELGPDERVFLPEADPVPHYKPRPHPHPAPARRPARVRTAVLTSAPWCGPERAAPRGCPLSR